MNSSRIAGTLLFGSVLLVLCIAISIPFLSGDISSFFYWGIPIGLVLSVSTWFYLAKTWDAANLQPKNPNVKKADWRLAWIGIIGIGIARIMPAFFGEDLTDSLFGCVATWVFLTIGYMVFQVWWQRPVE